MRKGPGIVYDKWNIEGIIIISLKINLFSQIVVPVLCLDLDFQYHIS
jgi:hypothetical protein